MLTAVISALGVLAPLSVFSAGLETGYSRLSPGLAQLMKVRSRDGVEAAEKFARRRCLEMKDDRVKVELVALDGFGSLDKRHFSLKRFDAEVVSSSEHFLLVTVPILRLPEFAAGLPPSVFIHEPSPIVPDVVSEGVEPIGAARFHDAGVQGRGVKVAVIDIGFHGYEDLVDRHELPLRLIMRNYADEGMNAGSEHGAACAEIIYDLIPEAEFHLVKIDDDADFENAVRYAVDEEIDIISMSLSWFIPYGDYYRGDDIFSRIADDAFEEGVLFVKSAGNYATMHYRADFDDDGEEDGYHRFADGVIVDHFGERADNYFVINPNTTITATLVWDDFPGTDQDLDLELVRRDVGEDEWEVVAVSDRRQRGEESPVEGIQYTVRERGQFGVRVLRVEGDEELDFTLFAGNSFAYRTPEGSIGVPGMAEGVVAVGAIRCADWDDEDAVSYTHLTLPTN